MIRPSVPEIAFCVDMRRVGFKTGDIITEGMGWERYAEGVVEIIDAAVFVRGGKWLWRT